MKLSLTDDEVIAEIRSDSLRNRVRKILSASAGRIEQACAQRRMPTPVEIRRMELEAAEEIIQLVTSDNERDRLFEEDDPYPPSRRDMELSLAHKRETGHNEFTYENGPMRCKICERML